MNSVGFGAAAEVGVFFSFFFDFDLVDVKNPERDLLLVPEVELLSESLLSWTPSLLCWPWMSFSLLAPVMVGGNFRRFPMMDLYRNVSPSVVFPRMRMRP